MQKNEERRRRQENRRQALYGAAGGNGRDARRAPIRGQSDRVDITAEIESRDDDISEQESEAQ